MSLPKALTASTKCCGTKDAAFPYREQLFQKVFDVVDKHPQFMEVNAGLNCASLISKTYVTTFLQAAFDLLQIDEVPLSVDEYAATMTVSPLTL